MLTLLFRSGTALVWFAVLMSSALFGQSPAPAAERAGAIEGLVVNGVTGEPVPAVTVRLLELGRSELSHQDGTFHFDRLQPGTYRVAAQRVGFAPTDSPVRVEAGEDVVLRLEMFPSAIAIGGLVVTGVGRARSADETYTPTSVLDDGELRRHLGSSVAATLRGQPGISQRYNGPAASQPVIRGLGGDRVLVLEDGNRTGDVSSNSADHAVTIEPLTAERIEVVRGPAGVRYGSNALGGVINVVREEVPRTLPEALTGLFSTQVESVNNGFTAGGFATGAVGHVALRGELSGRTAGDTRTPLGMLPSTNVRGYNASAGASWVAERGFAGVAVRDYVLRYGVPGSFGGITIPGAHVGGVTIDLRRSAARTGAALLTGVGPFKTVEWDAQYTRFQQDEVEQGGAVATSFGQLTASSNLVAHHQHETGGLLVEGSVGFWGLWQDHRVAGSAGSAPAQELTLATFAFEEIAWDPLRLQLGGRLDWTRKSPLDRRSAILGELQTREFAAFSGSVAGLYEPTRGLVLGASLSRSFRTPSIPELFSSGPHLADYSFNIGNPQLEAEYGTGADLFARLTLPRVSGEFAVYRNWINGYIYYAPTGRLDPRLQRFPLYQAASDDAVLEGAEGRVQWELLRTLVLDVTGSFVRGTRRGDDEPLPAIPPLEGGFNLRFAPDRFFVSAGVDAAARQDRVDEFEEPTAGYALWTAGAGLNWSAWGNLHTLTLQARNLTDVVWYDHLSRLKEAAPQPGRSIELLYRVSF